MIFCYSPWRGKIQLSHRWGKNLGPFSGSAGPSDWPGTGLRLVSVASFFLPLTSPSQIDLQPIVHLPWHVIRHETGFLSHISGGRWSLGERQEWGTATDQVPGHDSRPWSVYDFIPRSTVPCAWIFAIVFASDGFYIDIRKRCHQNTWTRLSDKFY